MSGNEIVTAAVLVIGDEILSGRTKDKNIGAIADHLCAAGIDLKEVRVVADDTAAIVSAVNDLRNSYNYVFTTGGIGPTHDDITADAIAAAFEVPIDVDPRALALLKPYYESRGIELTPSRLRMTRIPQGAELIRNAISIAPGFMLGNVIVLAGVPSIMQAMLIEVTPRLAAGRKILSETLDLGRPEGDIGDLFAAFQASRPDISMGSYPYLRDGRPCTQLVLRSRDAAALAQAAAELRTQLEERGIK